MIVVLKAHTSKEDRERVVEEVKKLGYEPRVIIGEVQSVVAAIGDETSHHTLESLLSWPQVETVLRVQKRYKFVSREGHPEGSVISINGEAIGEGQKFCVMAGPCSVESEEQILTTARAVKAQGAGFLRGGAFKPRTSPYEFQGLGLEGLELLAKAKKETGLAIVTEVLAEKDLDMVAEYADVLQIGTRNAQNFSLLTAVSQTGKPILLKRGMSMKVEEWLLAAEYILSNGNPNVILCERGIRTFETYTRNTLDLSAVAIAKKETHLPVLVDPSHAAGRADLIVPLSKASIAIGADGIIVEVHPNPAEALSDGQQQLDFTAFENLMREIQPLLNTLS